MKKVEFRDRSRRAPEGGIRIFLGRAETKRALAALEERKQLLERLARRGEYDVLQAIVRRVVTVEAVERLIDQHGITDYRAHLRLAPAPDIPPLDAHVERFLETVRKKGTRRTYRIGLQHLRDYRVDGERLGDRDWHTVRLHHVQDAQQRLLARLAPATVQTYTAAWSAFFDWARLREEGEAEDRGRDPILETNPVHRAKAWVTVPESQKGFMRHEQFERLMEVAPPMMHAQYATLVLCGLRGGEFRSLPPAHVADTHVQVAPWGEWVPKGYPRSKRAVRRVPVHPTRLRPLLEEYRREWAGDLTFFVNPRTGHPWSEGAFRGQFRKDAGAAGIEGVSPHICRHTFASWLARDDVQLLKIAQLLGDTVQTVERYYAHLLPSDLDATVLRLFGDSEATAKKNGPEK